MDATQAVDAPGPESPTQDNTDMEATQVRIKPRFRSPTQDNSDMDDSTAF